MTQTEIESLIRKIFESIERQIPKFKDSPKDWQICEGNVALCIIDQNGRIFGKLFGQDKIKQRQIYDIAWRKASQVWITGYKTGEYEKLVFAGKINPNDYGIELPDLMGWEGGQPIKLDEETKISVGFGGFRGINDLDIVIKAIDEALKGRKF